MNEYTIKIQIPDGFEPDDGLQPRCPKEGEYFLDDDTAKECHVDFEFNTHIILKKKKPKYVVKRGEDDYIDHNTYVEIKALEDALEIMRKNPLTFDKGEAEIYEALKELIK